ncbi:MAG: amidophosphoribosyltransferase [Flavobacteriales bacterium]|nr:amidophosphoribosyltransferase [Flavobacteriales bacterium]MCB9203545.1 amidophosphoribosyltransferase [Flavobacteriales bacterium]
MSDAIKHECGIAMVRLLKPLSYYKEKYGTSFYALNKMYLLMEKQHNRGQDGAGLANIKFDMQPGKRYISRYRSNSSTPIKDVFAHINERFEAEFKENPKHVENPEWLKQNLPFTGEIFLGHLRYGTFGGNSIEHCHPFLRQNNWMTRNLVLAGNFNMTNVDELFQQLVDLGQHPKEKADTVTVLEKIGHFIDVETDKLYRKYKKQGYSKVEATPLIAENINLQKVLKQSAKKWDGGYAIAGMLGHGDAFVMRDPSGIRPAHWYMDDEVIVIASERPAIQTAFNVQWEDVKEIKPGYALIIKKDGTVSEKQFREPLERKSCSFERIYFSRGSDKDIYEERKELGRLVVEPVLKEIEYDTKNTVFSYIPNTAETSFYGMVKGVEDYINTVKIRKILSGKREIDADEVRSILNMRARVEKLTIKDAKLRTFITDDVHRDDLVSHVYDITYGAVRRGEDNVVLIDDSIVRGTTLKQSILRIVDRLGPKKIVIVSSAPQIRYPDCYGIDMAKLGDFMVFRAAVELLKDTKQENILDDVYEKAKAQMELPLEQVTNVVKEIYRPFTAEQLSDKSAEIISPPNINAEVKLIFQSIEGLHSACPAHLGDWYFTGNYPTPGGNRVVNRAFINFMEGKNVRAY